MDGLEAETDGTADVRGIGVAEEVVGDSNNGNGISASS